MLMGPLVGLVGLRVVRLPELPTPSMELRNAVQEVIHSILDDGGGILLGNTQAI